MSTANIPSLMPNSVVIALLKRAERFVVDGQHDHASAFFRAAVAADQSPVAHIAYAVYLADSEREDLASTHLTEAWEMAKQLGDWKTRALACHNLAALCRRQGQFAAADSFQQQAIRAQLNAEPGEPFPVFLLAGRALDVAGRESVTAEKLLRATQADPLEEATALLNRGVIAFHQDRESLAMERFYAAFNIAQSQKDLPTCAAILTNVAHLQRDRGRWSIADECLALAEKINSDAKRPLSAQLQASYRRELARGLAMLDADPSWN